MPILLVGVAGFMLGSAGGFVTGGGIDGVSRLVKWGVIAGGAYYGAKHFKMIK